MPFLFLLSLSGKGTSIVHEQEIDSLEVVNITHRLKILLSKNLPERNKVLDLMNSLNKDGSWNGIDYKNTDVLSWSPGQHLGFVFTMAQAFANQESEFYQNKKLKAAIHQSMGFWLDHNFTSRNWWFNDIGAPNNLSNILVLMGGKITDAELLKALNLMRGSYLHQEGQNLVWRAGIQLKIGLVTFGRGHINLLGSPEDRIHNSARIMEKEVVVTPDEGIQPDWSFHQHGTQLQFGNYGLTFAQSQVEWAWVLNESSMRYSDDKVTILKNYILRGLGLVVWKNVMDLSGCGRSLAPGSPEAMGIQTINTISLLSEINPQDKKMYVDYMNRLRGDMSGGQSIPQNTYFWRSDFAVHRNNNYYLSVRTHSRFIQSTESGIGQNVSGAYLADGATYLYQTGKEYHDILPIWNWHRIPGTTSYPEENLPEFGWSGLPNESNFVGGVSDGKYGFSTMLFKRDKLTAYKSWFFGPMGLVCLGAGINSDKNSKVSTTVNQSLVVGNIEVGYNKRQINIANGKSQDRDDIGWVYHDRAGYIFLQKNNVHVGNEEQEGNWKKVYTGGNDKLVKGSIFNLWIDHGNYPNNASYAYAILPNLSLDSLKFYSQHSPVKIVQNDTLIQAVEYPGQGMAQIVFYKKGGIKIKDLGFVETDKACLLMIRKESNNLTLSISTPPEHGKVLKLNYDGHPEPEDSIEAESTRFQQKIIVSLSGHFEGENCRYNSVNNATKIEFEMPEGISEGRSIYKTIYKK
ncbi:MAG: polysaccharide lyase family 8 super-sandwich domain-containing protein [Ginsengibacter sp.]